MTNVQNLPVPLAVGDIVTEKGRMGAGSNKPVGVATVVLQMRAGSCGDGATTDTARYTVGGGGEKNLPATVLSLPHCTPASRKSSLGSSKKI